MHTVVDHRSHSILCHVSGFRLKFRPTVKCTSPLWLQTESVMGGESTSITLLQMPSDSLNGLRVKALT